MIGLAIQGELRVNLAYTKRDLEQVGSAKGRELRNWTTAFGIVHLSQRLRPIDDSKHDNLVGRIPLDSWRWFGKSPVLVQTNRHHSQSNRYT